MAISFPTAFADCGKVLATFADINAFVGSTTPVGAYKFAISAVTISPTVGATYTVSGVTYTVLSTVLSTGTNVVMSGNLPPPASGTLTKASGTGDATLTFSAVVQESNWGAGGPNIKCQATMVSDILTRLQGSGLTNLISFNNWQSAIAGLDQSVNSQKQVLAQLLQAIIIQRVNNDVPQQNPSSFAQAISEWILQMQAQSVTVAQATMSTVVTAGANNTGTATPYASLYNQNGLLLEYAFAETMTLECTQDQNSGATAGSEQVSVVSPAAAPSSLSYLWPAGSGLSANLTVVDPTQGYGNGQNLLGGGSASIGAFKAWTGGIPNGWAIGADSGNISDGTTNNYAGTAHCLQFTGNTAGTNLNTAVYQSFANGGITTGSPVTITPNTVYQFYAQVKASVVPAAGAVSFSLTDGSGTVINNNAGNPNTITTVVSGYGGTTYQTITGTFQTPTIMPADGQVRLQVRASTKITTSSNVFIDFVALTQPATQNYGGIYQGGPYLSIFRGDVDLVRFQSYTIGDIWTVAISNNYGSSSPLPLSFNILFNQLLGMAASSVILPSAGSPSVANSLIA